MSGQAALSGRAHRWGFPVGRAGEVWLGGRGLAIQNTSQYILSAAAVPLIARIIEGHGYAWAYALSAVPPLLALALVPRDPQ